MTTRDRHLVITVHGIRTYGDWQERLETLIKAADPDVEVQNYRFGYYSILAFLFPPTRWLVTRRFRLWLRAQLAETAHPVRVDIVAHSFGTHLVGWALRRLEREHLAHVHTLILAGSVLKSAFRWERLLNNDGVHRVINECGIRDNVLVLNQLCVLFTGMGGRLGFSGGTGERFRNRYHDWGHSGYFQGPDGQPSDQFMAREWIPLLVGSSPARNIDPRTRVGALSGIGMFLLNNTEPIKILIYATPFIALALYYRSLQLEALHQAQVATSRQLAAQSISRLSEELDLSLLLSVQALRLHNSGEAEKSLFESVQHEPRLVTFLRGHSTEVERVALSRDGRLMASASCVKQSDLGPCQGGEVRLWDIAAGKQIGAPLIGHVSGIVALAFSTDSTSIISIGRDRAAIRWTVPTGGRVSHILLDDGDTNDEVHSAALSADQSKVALGTLNGIVQLWSTVAGKFVGQTLGTHSPMVRSVAFSPDGRLLASGGDDATIRISGSPRMAASCLGRLLPGILGS